MPPACRQGTVSLCPGSLLQEGIGGVCDVGACSRGPGSGGRGAGRAWWPGCPPSPPPSTPSQNSAAGCGARRCCSDPQDGKPARWVLLVPIKTNLAADRNRANPADAGVCPRARCVCSPARSCLLRPDRHRPRGFQGETPRQVGLWRGAWGGQPPSGERPGDARAQGLISAAHFCFVFLGTEPGLPQAARWDLNAEWTALASPAARQRALSTGRWARCH